jgi:hypothetical protein
MENVNTQFFTNDQRRDLQYHIENLYDKDREDRKEAFMKTPEFKQILKEVNESDYAKEMQSDREALLENYDALKTLYDSIKANAGGTVAHQIFRIGNKSQHNWDESIQFLLSTPETNHLGEYVAMNAVFYGTNKKELEDDLCKQIKNRIRNRAENKLKYNRNSWSVEREISAIIATTKACELSQVIETVKERLPMEDVNAWSIKEDDDKEDDIDVKGCEPEPVTAG